MVHVCRTLEWSILGPTSFPKHLITYFRKTLLAPNIKSCEPETRKSAISFNTLTVAVSKFASININLKIFTSRVSWKSEVTGGSSYNFRGGESADLIKCQTRIKPNKNRKKQSNSGVILLYDLAFNPIFNI